MALGVASRAPSPSAFIGYTTMRTPRHPPRWRQTGVLLKVGDRIEVERSANWLLLVQNPELDYFGILREDLHCGER